MRVSLKSVSGVDSVDVSLEKGLASVKMKPGNAATLKQFQEAITKNGFTMKESEIAVAGTVVLVGGQPQLRVSGSNDLVRLIADEAQADASKFAERFVVVQGKLNEGAKGKAPDTIRYRAIQEGK